MSILKESNIPEPKVSELDDWNIIEKVQMISSQNLSAKDGWLNVVINGHQNTETVHRFLNKLKINPELVEVVNCYVYRTYAFRLAHFRWELENITVTPNKFEAYSGESNFVEEVAEFYIGLHHQNFNFFESKPIKATEKVSIPVTAFYVKEFDERNSYSAYEKAQKEILLYMSQYKDGKPSKSISNPFKLNIEKYGSFVYYKLADTDAQSKNAPPVLISYRYGNPSLDISALHSDLIEGLKTGFVSGRKVKFKDGLPLVGISWGAENFLFDQHGNPIEYSAGMTEIFENLKLFTDNRFIPDYDINEKGSKIQFEASRVCLKHITEMPDHYVWRESTDSKGKVCHLLDVVFPSGRRLEVAEVYQASNAELEQFNFNKLITDQAKAKHTQHNIERGFEFLDDKYFYDTAFKNEIHTIHYRDYDEIYNDFRVNVDPELLNELKDEIEGYVSACYVDQLQRNACCT